MPRTSLITGFPGFLAGRLIPRLLADDDEARIVALVEPRMVERARALAPDGVDVQPGDITDPTLGLDPQTYDRLAGEVVKVFHLAAVYDLAVGAELAERVNVQGTQHVVDFCRRAANLERHHYISTAYVAGRRSGLVLEADLAAGQAFKNFYESTKFAAEILVRASMEEIPTTVYRPAIVVGDSQTGETQKFDGPYYLLRSMSGPTGALLQVGRGDAPFNVVPVDFVVSAIAAGSRDPEAVGHTLHLVDPEPVSSHELARLLALEYRGHEPRIPLPPGVVDRSLKYAPIRKLFGGTPRESIVYLNHPVRFDTAQAAEILGRNGLRCPPFSEYVGEMVAFFVAHEHDDAYRPPHEK
ncbi:MAG TPA: SDR family oxidoreductase [Baekduia sp.]|uniref:SDR family oxidoreductase n=1 Tax=Baekduia sp. TaxID=2600305 RepID=UPI002C54232E|nr:SDR family oxidoreductase [Baekduia sp.]HMJ34062.1 SDR family oxidoreductase [Baekduia sp.]